MYLYTNIIQIITILLAVHGLFMSDMRGKVKLHRDFMYNATQYSAVKDVFLPIVHKMLTTDYPWLTYREQHPTCTYLAKIL